MLLIIELLFLVAGLWAIISGKLPGGLLQFLFGKGRYELAPTQTRWFGVLLASPLVLAYTVSYLLRIFLGTNSTGYALIFEICYNLVVIILAIIIVHRSKHPEPVPADGTSTEINVSQQKKRGYSVRLLIMIGIVVLGCIIFASGGALIGTVISAFRFGGHLTGDFWQDEFPFIVIFLLLGLGVFGIVKLFKLLRD
jgi:hypothetical protein